MAAPTAIALALIPLRSSLGLAGALLCGLVAVVGVALLGGIRPALLATGVGFLASDFLFTAPLHSLRVARPVDLAGLIVFVVVAVVVGGSVDLLTRQGVRVARARAEADNLARLAADGFGGSTASGDLAEAVGAIRRVFDLDGVAILRREPTGWRAEATAGRIRLEDPGQAPFSVEISRNRLLALAGERPIGEGAPLLHAFLDQLKLARERRELRELRDHEGTARTDGAPGPPDDQSAT